MSHAMAVGPQELGQTHTGFWWFLSGKGNAGALMNNSLGFIIRQVDNVFRVLS